MPGGSGRRDPLDFSLFTYPSSYRAVAVVKAFAVGLLYGGIFFAGVVWFEVAVNEAVPAYTQVAGSSGWLRWWVEHGMIPVVPAWIATVLFLVGLKIGFKKAADASGRQFVWKAAGYLGAVLLAGWALARCPGSSLARYAPFAAAVLLPWYTRKWRSYFDRRNVRRPTRAGFRPAWRAVLSVRGYVALENVDATLPLTSWFTSNKADVTPDESAALFRRRGDYRTAAYCITRVVEHLLAHNRIVDAEARIRAAAADPDVRDEPVFKTARAEFLAAVGDYEEALRLLREARAQYGRPLARLDALILIVAIDSGRSSNLPEPRWSEWRRIKMVWLRQSATVILGLAADAWATAATDSASAMNLAYQVCGLPERLAVLVPDDEFDLDVLEQARIAKGLALDTVAQIYAQREQHFDASLAFLDAYEEFAGVKNRRRACRSLILGYVNAMMAGYSEPEKESHALDMIRAGLKVLEGDRGTLRTEDSRARWITSQQEIYAQIFCRLTAVRYQQAKAAELGFWLLESLHRSMTADLLAAHGALEADPSLRAALAELSAREASTLQAVPGPLDSLPKDDKDLIALRNKVGSRFGSVREAALLAGETDTETMLMRLGDRTAVLYHCWQEDRGWVIHSALASARHGIHVHRGRIPAPSPDSTVSPWLTAAGAFDAIAAGDETIIEYIFDIPLGDPDFPLWEEIAQALFPGSWREMLRPTADSGNPEVLIVPDGPIASLPLAALPGWDGRPLLETVPIALAPSLSMLDVPGSESERNRSGHERVVVVHRDDRTASGLSRTAREAEHWSDASRRMRVIETANQADIQHALQGPRPPDVIAISAHGFPGQADEEAGRQAFSAEVWLRDGSVLSEASALRLPWPSTVILASCWVGAASVAAGREPSGFPLSCMLRGATTVIGGAAPIPDEQTADALCRIIDGLPSGADTLTLLQQAQAAEVHGKPFVTAAEAAGLTAWTTAAAKSPARRPAPPTHWDAGSLPRAETVTAGTLVPEATFSEASRRVLAYARYLAAGRPVGTLDFLAAAFTADSADWAGFSVACETGEPVLPGDVNEAASGTLTAALGQAAVTITVPLATAIHRAHKAASHLGDETTLPAHVILAALADDTTAAGKWIRRDPRSPAAHWPQHLSDRIFGTDLPDPGKFFGPEQKTAPVHRKRMTGSSITTSVPEKRKARWWLPVAVAGLLLVLPANFTLAHSLQTAISRQKPVAHGYLGVALENVTGGAFVEIVRPGSPADNAGLRAGDVITAIAGQTDDGSATKAVALIESHAPGQTISLSILRYGQPITIYATLGQQAP
jgi:CHAT domain/PDZ domain